MSDRGVMELTAGMGNDNPYNPQHMKTFGPSSSFVSKHISLIAKENLPGYVEATEFKIASCAIFCSRTGEPWMSWKRKVRLFAPPTSTEHDLHNIEYTMIISNFFFTNKNNVYRDPRFKGLRTIRGGKEIADNSAAYISKKFSKSVPALTVHEEIDPIDGDRSCITVFDFSPRTVYHRARLAVLRDPDYPTDSVTLIVKLPPMSTEVDDSGKVIHFSSLEE